VNLKKIAYGVDFHVSLFKTTVLSRSRECLGMTLISEHCIDKTVGCCCNIPRWYFLIYLIIL